MHKIILSILLVSLNLMAINFKETKFIEAFELETYRYGSIEYEKEKTIIHYKDGKIITKLGDTLTVHNQKNELLTTIDLRKKPQIALYFKLTKALFSKNFTLLENNFTIKKQQLKYTFIPKGETAYVVNHIDLLLKKDGSVIYFIIDFKNKDNIKIETI